MMLQHGTRIATVGRTFTSRNIASITVKPPKICRSVIALRQAPTSSSCIDATHTKSADTLLCRRHLSSSSGGDNNNNTTNDPFGVNFDDGEENLGPVSDSTAADDKYAGLTEEEKQYLSLSEEEREVKLFAQQFEETWTPEKRKRLAERVQSRQAEKARIGRENAPKDWSPVKEYMESKGEKWSEDMQRRKERRIQSEIEARKKQLEEQGKDWETEKIYDDWVPPSARGEPEIFEGDLNWMAKAPSLSSYEDDDESVDLSQYGGRKKVNCKQAVPIPKEELHHNNLALLRKYITPGGQIKPRIQTRLGAKDQRKISKLIKRSRALGLIPTTGNFKVRDNGDVFADDLDEPLQWEVQLAELMKEKNIFASEEERSGSNNV
mmetsp:Transcript_9925/g.14851  ORF Transcript_9925/g.14851 Transcript_9925/m.14851 type:complete len:379 (-) Transcript_9925:205-1341(-)